MPEEYVREFMTESVTAADLHKKLASLIDLKAGVEDRIPISMQVPTSSLLSLQVLAGP